jgi:hypothetical protein
MKADEKIVKRFKQTLSVRLFSTTVDLAHDPATPEKTITYQQVTGYYAIGAYINGDCLIYM